MLVEDDKSFAKPVSSHVPHWEVPVSADLKPWTWGNSSSKVAVFSQRMVRGWALPRDRASPFCPFLPLSWSMGLSSHICD